MHKHTPFPWFTKHGKTNIFGKRNDVGHEGLVCSANGHDSNQFDTSHENEANAALILAIPVMQAALMKTLEYLAKRADGESNELWAIVAAAASSGTGESIE